MDGQSWGRAVGTGTIGTLNEVAFTPVRAKFVRITETAAPTGTAPLRIENVRLLEAPAGVLGWVRAAGADRRAVLVNFSASAVDLEGTEALGATAGWHVEVATDGVGEGAAFTGRLGPDQAVWLRPA